MSEHSSNLPDFNTLQDGDVVLVRLTVKKDDRYPDLRDMQVIMIDDDGCAFESVSVTFDFIDYLACAVSVTRKAVQS